MEKSKILFFNLFMVLFSLIPQVTLKNELRNADFMRTFFMDSGRKYFPVEEVLGIIDQLSAKNFNYLEMGIGNNGFRLILDDMTIGEYSSSSVISAIKYGNKEYDKSVDYVISGKEELTESEMNTIINYAFSKGIEIIPLINVPGHATALVNAMANLGIRSTGGGEVNILNAKEIIFVTQLVKKYAKYFRDKGCNYYNFGADEYSRIQDNYSKFAEFFNKISFTIKNENLQPKAFNDCIYKKNLETTVPFDTSVFICYWVYEADKYSSVQELTDKGFTLLNYNNAWYYVLGDYLYVIWEVGQWGYKDSKKGLQTTPVTEFNDGNTSVPPAGATLCFWCDYPGCCTFESVKDQVYDLIATMSDSNPEFFGNEK